MAKPPTAQRGKAQSPQPPQHQAEIVSHKWSGPLPPPAALAQFDAIIPGGADRILKMAEREQTHRIECEATGLGATIREARRGQYLGGIISIIGVGGATLAAYSGSSWQVIAALLGVPLLGMVVALIRPRVEVSSDDQLNS